MRTTTYRAPDKSRGYTGGEIAAILSRHHPAATVVARVGWRGQVQQLIVTEPDPLGSEARCETPAPEDMPTGLGPNLQRRIDGLPEYRDDVLQGIARATADEELVREALRDEGVDVAAVERAARRAQQRGLGGAL